jgi:hypothetical protein
MEYLIFLVSVSTATIAYFQWTTAHQKVIADLFDRRMKVYLLAEEAASSVLKEAKADDAAVKKITNALIYSRFLFGADVENFLAKTREDIIHLHVYDSEIIDQLPDRSQQIDKKYKALERVSSFSKTSPPVFGPYMRLTHRLRYAWLPG